MKKLILIVFLSLNFIACKIEPKAIDFGLDACHFCKMTIIDKPFAAEIVTEKGKIYKYDAIECMIKNQEVEQIKAALLLVFDFENPTNFINATDSYYVVSAQINSPMGENLAAFLNKTAAEKFVKNNGGNHYNWTEISNYFKTKATIKQ